MARASKSKSKDAAGASTDETPETETVGTDPIDADTPAEAPEARDMPAEAEAVDTGAEPEVPSSDETPDEGPARRAEPDAEVARDVPSEAPVAEDMATEAETLHAPEDETPDDVTEPPIHDDDRAEPVVRETPVAAPASEPRRSGSAFWPLVLGGLVAGIIGFALAEYDVLGTRGDSDALRATLDDQQARLSALEEAEAPAAPDLSGMDDLSARVDSATESADAATSELAALSDRLATLEQRLTTLEDRPMPDGGSLGDTAAYERELANLQDAVERQNAEVAQLLENAQAAEEQSAATEARARIRTALAEVRDALTSGQPFAEPLAAIAAEREVPAALSDVADAGVVTLATLQAEFPDTARAALAAARDSGEVDGEGGVGGFLRRQLGARSVAPRPGADPDAVLSRAEDAVRRGDLAQALNEIDTLSDGTREALGDWLPQARARHDAVVAANDIAADLPAN